ncbi:D-lactaldehyde dehydrogenase [Mycena alexandri]|uniref:D-lactaldehyde dehydrogenase n=1 Tax=Mycena alexandri TaxID=1745969 RepID=A0AAD6X3G6_9AGAR|nr:D-lactaldehyde dehydrogenase [Mycena alexandri]
MPTISSGKVLVSGANGYVAVWVVRTLLEEGYSVRGAVRSPDKGKHLTELFASYGDKFELAIVPDITKEGAFDEAVKGVDAIEHTASPYHFQADDPAELIEPAVKGTVGILESARKYGFRSPESIKRVVVTSSTAAVLNVAPTPQILDESNWNDQAVEEVTEKGRAASAAAKYRVSKMLAERAAWDFVKKHKDEIGWDLSVMNPPLVLGPTIHEVASADALNTSARMLHDAFAKGEGLTGGGCWIDVRDLALAHVRALQKEEAGCERIIINFGAFLWQDWLDAAPASSKYQNGTPGAGKDAVWIRILGIRYRTMKDTAADVIKEYEARGW